MGNEAFRPGDPLHVLGRRLAGGEVDSRSLTWAALERVDDPGGQGSTAFIRVYRERAPVWAEAADRLRESGVVPTPLAGLPVSLKDLFDVAGEVTTAGSLALRGGEPAQRDAPVVARLRAAGAVLLGRTNMTEFAYSGLGANPHYGTPLSPWRSEEERVAGGSTSGGAVSVAEGMAAAALGTDTGGSVRIPAAFCAVCGFKPTARRIPRRGAIPLSRTLDSVGAIAPTAACCALLDAVLAGLPPSAPDAAPLDGLRLGVPASYLVDDLDPAIEQAFEKALRRLSKAGAIIREAALGELEELPAHYRDGGLLAIEAYAWHRELLESSADSYDPRVAVRIRAGEGRGAAEYIDLLDRRLDLIERFDRASEGFDALAAPTVACPPPRLRELEEDEDYLRINMRVLRNTSAANFLDRPSLTIPCHREGDPPVGFMLIGPTLGDRRLLAVGQGVESAIRHERIG